MGTIDGGLGLPRLSDQVNLRKWSMLNRLQQRGGLPAIAVTGLLTRASEVSGGQFILPGQGDFIGPFSPTPVCGSSLGALGPDSALCLATILGPTHPLLRPLSLGLPRLDNLKLLRTFRHLELSTWADLTSRAPDGTRAWLDLTVLLPDLALPAILAAPPTVARLSRVHKTGSILANATGTGYDCAFICSFRQKSHILLHRLKQNLPETFSLGKHEIIVSNRK